MTSRQTALLPWFLFLGLGLMWGSSYLFIKFGVETLQPFQLISARMLIGFVILWLIVGLWKREPLPRDATTYGHLIVMSIINIIIPFALITWAEQSVDSAVAAIINGAVPLFIIVPAALFLPDEPITLNKLVSLPLGFIGVVLLVVKDLGVGGSNALGAIALLGATLAYAFGGVYSRKFIRNLRPMIPALFQVSFAVVWSVLLMLLLEGLPTVAAFTPTVTLSVLWLGIFGSSLAYLAFFRLLQDWGATRTALLAYLLPVVGIVLGVAVRNEQIDIRAILGTGLILLGIGLANSKFGARRLWGRGKIPTATPTQTNAAATAAEGGEAV
ncbi:MAG TPA: DMT family transporter [Candidatus Polarisedimenticolia bacterium]|nr:DMT family transporter [Candidatus Polarisedimenticolia bacterium]